MTHPGRIAVDLLTDRHVDVTGQAMQLHEGMSYTWQSGIHVYLKRPRSTGRYSARRPRTAGGSRPGTADRRFSPLATHGRAGAGENQGGRPA
jgi:alkylation response protein AidB-like acyl-CoA dehydrogenase